MKNWVPVKIFLEECVKSFLKSVLCFELYVNGFKKNVFFVLKTENVFKIVNE
jgi:hypothetical protein